MNPNFRRAGFASLLAMLLASTSLANAGQADRTVGPQANGTYVASNNQTLTPAGTLVQLGSPVVAKAVALNPNTKTKSAAVLLMAAAEPIIVFDTVSGAVLQRFLPTTVSGTTFSSDSHGSFTGLTYSADGKQLYFSQDDNHLVIANVNPVTGLLTPGQSVTLPKPPVGPAYYNSSSINPAGIAIYDQHYAAVVLNAANTVGIVDLTQTPPTLVNQIPVGNAPNSIVISGTNGYVSNEGGRPATSGDFTNLSDGTPIVADPVNAFATTGTVSVIDANTLGVTNINVGLHPAGMTIDGDKLYVTNSFSDTVSVINTKTNKVIRTINVGIPVEGRPFGAGPNGIVVVGGTTAYVTLGQSNAVAVVDLALPDQAAVIGYIPTAYFPSSIAYDAAHKQLIVCDDKGIGAQGSIGTSEGASAYNTHQETATVSLIPLPNAKQLAKYTQQVIENNHWNLTANIEVGPEFIDWHAKPVAIPKHIGEPSLIKHVFLIIKENRTYDQMLGDLPQGNGDPSIAVFASAVPNQKAFVQRFPLLDNTYAPSRQSADGHPWIVESGSFYSNDILSPDWIRSYPGGNSNDALTYTPKGFLWSAAAAAGKSVKMYGEWSAGYTIAAKPGGGSYSWSDFFNTSLCKEGLAPASSCIVPDNSDTESAAIPSTAAILDPHYPSFNLGIPDQYRMDYYLPIFQQQVLTGTVPNLTIIWLPDDHTAGTSTGYPLPINMQADNDLALGRLVEAISNSKAWESSAIFVEEDDSQDGVDHVDGHRQPVYVISPYTVAPQAPNVGKVISTTYTQENINRTIENILGMEPLTQFDLVASPMFDVFQNTPNLAPFTHVPAVIPLNQGPGLPGNSYGLAGNEAPEQKAWLEASTEMMKDKYNKADAVDETFLNHVIWYSATNWNRPYPGETKIQMPDSFVKAAAAKKDIDGDDD